MDSMNITLKINGNEVKAEEGMTILEAAQNNDIYIPRLCYHPSLGSSHGLKPVEVIHREDGEYRNDSSGPEDGFPGCRLCLVEIEGREGLFTSCDTIAKEGMEVNSETDAVKEARRDNLAEILKDHPHACLQCAQQEGCSRTQCSMNVPEDERCCPLLGHCELQKVAQYIGIRQDLPKYVFRDLPRHNNEALFDWDYNLCIGCLRCVRACRDLRGVEALGFVYKDSKVIVGPTKSSMYAESGCRFCGACVEVCPTGALTDKDLPRGEREEILVPCIASCPAGIDIPRYIRLINEGRYTEAAGVIKERMPFPGILGRICFRPCEDACRRGELNQPMAICGLKWFAADNDGSSLKLHPKGSTGKRIAIVGSGPSGLSAAYYLALSGHSVTVFEAEEKIGGMLRYAIPDYRLPPEILEEELGTLNELNVEFRTDTSLGKEITLAGLRKDFHAVFLGIGAGLSKRIPVEGSDIEGVEWGLDFLRDVKKKRITSMSGRLLVIGGGDVAIDCARSALRLGAEVTILYRRTRKEMPAHDWGVEEAEEEGVKIHYLVSPKRILGNGGKVAGVECIRMELGEPDKSGRRRPISIKGSEFVMDAGTIIIAIGQMPNLRGFEELEQTPGRTIKVDSVTFETNIPGIFAGGDIVRGPSSVVEAVADGATAASAIDRYLGGDGGIYPALVPSTEPDPYIGRIEGFADMSRVDVPKNDADIRKNNFEMVETGYDETQAKQEAMRCLRCDLRLGILPVTLPPDKWLELNEENAAEVPAVEGVFQLLDENRMIIVIKGTMNIRADLMERLKSETRARYFGFEPDPMYTKRESELIQQFLQQFGKMPEGDGVGEDLDDLF